jgi:hypothetical protein
MHMCVCIHPQVLSTRVREPVDHYLSSYLWATAWKASMGSQKSRPKAEFVRGRYHAVLPQPSFVRWAPADLQSRSLRRGGSAAFITDDQTGRAASKQPPNVTHAGLKDVLWALENDFDVVSPLDKFDGWLIQVAARLGIANASALRCVQSWHSCAGASSQCPDDPSDSHARVACLACR